MLKKLWIMLLITLVALSAFAKGEKEKPAEVPEKEAVAVVTAQYKEAPLLQEMVKKGELPSIDKRLPDEPLVVKPFENIGAYGGTLNGSLYRQPSDGDVMQCNAVSLTYLNTEDLITVEPGLIREWDFSDNYKTITIYFRKGTKWSDGVPFTTEDVLFWYQDCLMNKDIFPVVSSFWKGSSVKTIDDHTIQFTFPDPNPHFFRTYGIRNNNIQALGGFLLPKHYAKQFHIKYNPDAQKEAEKAGFDKWYQLLTAKASFDEHLQNNPDVPVLSPWRVFESTPDYILWERNPYFWAVDTEGNQLPYIDRLMGVFALDAELRKAKILSGEVDVACRDLSLSIFPELKKKEKELGYKVWTAPFLWTNIFFLAPNQTHEDPKKRELFQNIKFRQALSLALDREEINELVFMGLAVPQQTMPVSGVLHDEELAKYYLRYDPEEANRLLDEAGLDKRNSQGYRTWADGKDLKLKLNLRNDIAIWLDVAEVVTPQLREIGLDITIDPRPWATVKENLARGTIDIAGMASGAGAIANDLFMGIHGTTLGFHYANAWHQWRTSAGQQGEEPPEWLKKAVDLNNQIRKVSQEEAVPMIQEVFEIVVKQLCLIGTLAQTPGVYAIRDTVKNVDQSLPWTESGLGTTLIAKPFQWYFEK